MTAAPTAVFDADVEGVEGHEANLGTIVEVTLPSGTSTVTGIRRGDTAALGMVIEGYNDKRRDEICIRKSQFNDVSEPVPIAKQVLQIKDFGDNVETTKAWLIDSVQTPDEIVYFFTLVQNY